MGRNAGGRGRVERKERMITGGGRIWQGGERLIPVGVGSQVHRGRTRRLLATVATLIGVVRSGWSESKIKIKIRSGLAKRIQL